MITHEDIAFEKESVGGASQETDSPTVVKVQKVVESESAKIPVEEQPA